VDEIINKPGRVVDYQFTPYGLQGRTDEVSFKIITYSSSIFRIWISKNSKPIDFSYAVTAEPVQIGLKTDLDSEAFILNSGAVQTSIARQTLNIRFSNTDGNTILEDVPDFGICWIGTEVNCYKKLRDDEKFIGLGEKTGDLNRRGKGYVNWNTDSYDYGIDDDPLYLSIPFYIGIHKNGIYGIFLDNSHKSYFNFGASNTRFSSFGAEDGDLNYYFIHGQNVAEIIKSYTDLTGRTPIPPRWSLGFLQCRFSYYPYKEVLNIARTFREKKIPADAIFLDIHYMDRYKTFSWDSDRFPHPEKLRTELKKHNYELVVILNPGIKIEKDYRPYEEGLESDVFLKYPDGSPAEAAVWPGICYFPDFTNPATRKWWGKQLSVYTKLKIAGFWNDMNEPASWGDSFPQNIIFDFEGHKGTTRKGRNLYGLLMARSTYENAKWLLKNKRPFNLTRAGFSGIQRHAAVWTGDNKAEDEHMLLGVRLINSLGISGVPFCGYDIGGFSGVTSAELFARWLSIGVFSPFCRVHKAVNKQDSEPWSYGERVEEICKNYIQLRYTLLPYLYSLLFETSQSGMPVCRSLAIDHPFDDRVFRPIFQNQYLFGPWMLICPVKSSEQFVKVYLPKGKWYDFHNGYKVNGDREFIVEAPLEKLPVFIKAGSIIPTQSSVQNTKNHNDGNLYLHIYHGKNSYTFDYYDDDGETFNYEKGSYSLRSINYNGSKGIIDINVAEGGYLSRYHKLVVLLHGFDIKHLEPKSGGKKLAIKKVKHAFLEQITKIDPLEGVQTVTEEIVSRIELDYTSEDLKIELFR